MIYQWRAGATFSAVDPQKAGEQLAAIREAHGHITPELVVLNAQSPTSPLNPLFEWDEARAAHEYRLEQARAVCRLIVAVTDISAKPYRAFLHVKDSDGTSVYQPMAVVMADSDLRGQVLATAWRELQSWRTRYEDYKEFSKVFAAVDETTPLFQKAV